MNAKTYFLKAIILLTFLPLVVSNAYACDCSAASLLGTQVNVKLGGVGGSAVNKTVNVTNGVELPKVNASSGSAFIPNSNYHTWDIDIQAQSIIINFNYSNGSNWNYGQGNSLTFRYISPQLPTGNCSPKIVGINATSNRPGGAPWVNTKSIFSDDYVTIFYSKNGSPVTNWVNGQWVKVDLTFGCDQKMGMTWGFAGSSDIWANGVTQSCNHRKARFACKTYPVNSPQSNYCGTSYPSGVETSTVDNGTRQCDPVNGDTACSTEKHVLCIAEAGNPYFKRWPPYSGSAGYPNNINLIPFNRTRYKIHSAHSVPNLGKPAEYFEGWVDQFVKLSRHKVSGESLANNGGVAAGNAACGAGWRMASFNDGKWVAGMGLSAAYGNIWPPASKQSGGWAFHANMAPNANKGSLTHHGDSGGIPTLKFVKERYWVNSTQGGNCWN